MSIVTKTKQSVEIETTKRNSFRVVPAENGGWLIMSDGVEGYRCNMIAGLSSDAALIGYLVKELGVTPEDL
jgi:hypothetical protein